MDKKKLGELYPDKKIYGPYVRVDGRSYLVVADIIDGSVTRDSKKTSLMVSRAVMEISLGRRLLSDEHVDHINRDHTNDSLNNLQVLSITEHREKSGRENSELTSKRVVVTCPGCNGAFLVQRHVLATAEDKGRSPCCSRQCASAVYGRNQYSPFGLFTTTIND